MVAAAREEDRACPSFWPPERKVRASQGAMPDNVRAGQPDGKCHRKNTARVQGIGYRGRAFHDPLYPAPW